MFQFPAFACTVLCIQTAIRRRFRIQTPLDHRLFAGSPGHFGGYTVFLRLCTPSHPPYTLCCLTTLILHRPLSDPQPPPARLHRPEAPLDPTEDQHSINMQPSTSRVTGFLLPGHARSPSPPVARLNHPVACATRPFQTAPGRYQLQTRP